MARRITTKAPQHSVTRFDSWSDFLNAAEPESITGGHLSSRSGDPKWTGTPDFESAVIMGREGWSEMSDEIYRMTKEIKESIVEQIRDAFEMHMEVSGGMVDIGRYLEGEPECMIEMYPAPQPQREKVVRILSSISFSSGISAKDIIRRGVTIAAMVECLEHAGCGTEVWIECSVKGYGNGNKTHTSLINVKRADETLDSAHLAYAVAHPSVLRRLIFSLEENEPIEIRKEYHFGIGGGYGMPHRTTQQDEIGADIVADTMHLGTSPEQWIIANLNKLGFLRDETVVTH